MEKYTMFMDQKNQYSENEVTQSCPTLETPWTTAYQAPPSMGFSRQKYWSGVPLPSPSSKGRSIYIFIKLKTTFKSNYDFELIFSI